MMATQSKSGRIWTKRRVAVLVCAVVAFAIIAGVWRIGRALRDRQARQAWESWSLFLGGRSAMESGRALSELERRFGDAFLRLPARTRGSSFMTVGEDYFWEGDYRSAARMSVEGLRHCPGSPIREYAHVGYIVAVAGDRPLLQALSRGSNSPLWGSYLEAVGAYCDGDWEGVVSAADGAFEQGHPGANEEECVTTWLLVLKAEALAKLGRAEHACQELSDKEEFINFDALRDKDARFRVVLSIARIALQANRKQEARTLLLALKRRFSSRNRWSWRKAEEEVDALLRECATKPASRVPATGGSLGGQIP